MRLTNTVAVTATALFVLVACGNDREMETYLSAALPILQSHGDVTESTNAANVSVSRAAATGNRDQIIGAITTYRNEIDRAVARIEVEIGMWRGLTVPKGAREIHLEVLDALLKEIEGLQGLSSSYSATLAGAQLPPEIVNDANERLKEAFVVYTGMQQRLAALSD